MDTLKQCSGFRGIAFALWGAIANATYSVGVAGKGAIAYRLVSAPNLRARYFGRCGTPADKKNASKLLC
jgi:hypothetical protein